MGLALRANGFTGEIVGAGPREESLKTAQAMGAIDSWVLVGNADAVAASCDVILLCGPVLTIMDWMQRLAPVLHEGQLVTDVGSTKVQITELGTKLYNRPGTARFLPGHPMAGKESGGAALAEATLFHNAMWLFTPQSFNDKSGHKIAEKSSALEADFRNWVTKFGARTLDLDPARHDQLVAWVSHLPQMLATALSAELEDALGAAPELASIGGRALREMTRLGASPYSMWRDIAHTNADSIAATLHALEQRIAHIRENLKTPQLREEFERANEFRKSRE